MCPTNNVCTVIVRTSPVTGEYEMLVVKSRTTNPKTGIKTEWRVKFPGGGQEGPNEPVEGTRDREVWQETRLAFLKSKKIWDEEVSPEHTKHGYFVRYEDCSGELRKDILIDGDDELMPPEWVPMSVLGRSLYVKHQPLFMAACRELRVF